MHYKSIIGNTQHNDLEKVAQYLEEIEQNIQADMDKIDELSELNELKVNGLKKTIQYYYKAEDSEMYIDSIRALVLNGQISRIGYFNSSKSGMNAVLGSGDINLVPDVLRVKLNSYYNLVAENIPLKQRVTSETRRIVQGRLLKQVADRASVQRYLQLNISATDNSSPKNFKIEDDLATELMFLIKIVEGHNKELLEIKDFGQQLKNELQE